MTPETRARLEQLALKWQTRADSRASLLLGPEVAEDCNRIGEAYGRCAEQLRALLASLEAQPPQEPEEFHSGCTNCGGLDGAHRAGCEYVALLEQAIAPPPQAAVESIFIRARRLAPPPEAPHE
jgi:hypothetical protein